MQRHRIFKENYSWGKIRRIEVEHSFTVIIHPEHLERIERLVNEANAENAIYFKDEQKKRWMVQSDGDCILFNHKGQSVIVDAEKLI